MRGGGLVWWRSGVCGQGWGVAEWCCSSITRGAKPAPHALALLYRSNRCAHNRFLDIIPPRPISWLRPEKPGSVLSSVSFHVTHSMANRLLCAPYSALHCTIAADQQQPKSDERDAMNTATKPRKLTTLEKRAKRFCEDLVRYSGGCFTVEWKKSAMYGHCPSLEYCGEKIAYAGGCGYCKLSACLAEALCWLGSTPEQCSSIARTQGAGVSSVQGALRAIGWNLEGVAGSSTSDSFKLTKVEG